ncbi:MAG: hypothetical protein KY464_12455 [Gemmatimonadetes bacterium]|nr:hypothetical protein [Gemmatimonadota bacterium]
MRWIAQTTSASSRFLVITGNGWEPFTAWAWGIKTGWQDDRVSEWFPVLAERVSVATPQAYEWLPDNAFGTQVLAYRSARPFPGRQGDLSSGESWRVRHLLTTTRLQLSPCETPKNANR